MLNSQMSRIHRLTTTVLKPPNLNPAAVLRRLSTGTGDDEWNDAWETAWIPDETSAKSPWESDVTFSLPNPQHPQTTLPTSESNLHHQIDPETQAFVEDMNDNWDQRKGKSVHKDDAKTKMVDSLASSSSSSSLYSLQNVKRDYRLKKQKIHAALWVNEIEKLEEAKLGDPGVGHDIDKLFHSASRIFDSPSNNLGNSSDPNSELKNKPDGWETTSKIPDGSIWDISQREEDILVQEFERRIAFNKFKIASFIKNHIFSRRRPIDGWKYIIEEIGPNARRGEGSVSRLPSVSDESTQPFREETPTISTRRPSNSSYNRR